MKTKCFVKKAGVLLILALMVSSVGVTAANTGTQTTTGTFMVVTANPNVWYVKADAAPGGDGSHTHPFQHIQDGIDHASTDDTVFVESGAYIEYYIVVEKSIHLIGENKDTTILDGNYPCRGLSGPVIGITVDCTNRLVVEISGFTIKRFETAINCLSGKLNIHGNIIEDNINAGIILARSGHKIQGNTIINNGDLGGLALAGCSSLNDFGGSTDNLKNFIDGNQVGVSLAFCSLKFTKSYFYSNNIFGTHNGVDIKRFTFGAQSVPGQSLTLQNIISRLITTFSNLHLFQHLR